MLSGHPVEAGDAQTMDIIAEIAEPEALMDRALTVARDYAENPPFALASIKAPMAAMISDLR